MSKNINNRKTTDNDLFESFTQDLLKTIFINPYIDICKTYTPKKHPNGKPLLQALFYERNDLFTTLIDALIKQNDHQLYQHFTDYLLNCGFTTKMLFSFTQKSHFKMLNTEAALLDYSNLLIEQGAYDKADKLSTIFLQSSKLHHNFAAELKKMTKMKEETLSINYKVLQFKLNYIRSLNQFSETLSKRRASIGPKNDNHYKKIITLLNILSTLLVFPILINKVVNNIWFFKPHTTSIEKVRCAQSMLEIPKVEIKTNKAPQH